MITLYHGATVLFGRPSASKIKEGFANSEYGVGFNTSDYGGDAWEHARGLEGGPGVIYKYEFDETRLSNWLVSGQPIGQEMYDRIVANISHVPDIISADRILNDINPEMDGFEVFGYLQGRRRSGVDFMKRCGIEGAQTGNYYVFFDVKDVPEQKIDRVLGDFPAAKAAHEEQKRTGKLVVDQPVKYDGTPVGPRRHYLSEELGSAAHAVYQTGDQHIIDAFEAMTRPLLTEEELTRSSGNGFDYRNNLGLAIQRSLRDGGDDISDHWSGANTFARTIEHISYSSGRTDLVDSAQKVLDEIKRHARNRAPV